MGLRTCAQHRCPALVEQGYCPTHSRDKEAERPWRAWYKSARWAALRRLVRYEQPLCDDCQAEGRDEVWTDLDHTIPHRGDPLLFWSRENVRGKCKRHHSEKTARGQ